MTALPVALLALLSAGPLTSARVVAVSDGHGPSYERALTALEQAGAAVEKWSVDDPALSARLSAGPETLVWVALGARSAQRLAASGNHRAACALVPRAQMPASLPCVASEPPAPDVLSWMAAAFPGRTRVLLLGGSADAALAASAKGLGLQLVPLAIRAAAEAVPAVEAALGSEHADALLWLRPDPGAVTADTVGPLIETALAYRVPAVGTSDYFLKAGAVAAVRVDGGQSAVQAALLAQSGATAQRSPDAKLVVDGRRAERLGILVRAAPHVEVSR